ncbi:MAG: serine O-acetyltransferase [Candidatus Latescibacteria bacterium]|nr:serine O-acetyltransferase [Candidatus Latescibacterota bacterium]
MKIVDDFKAVFERDPAARGFWSVITVFLTYPGFHAICLHRLAHFIHSFHIPVIPHIIMWFSRFITGIEIHPAAKIDGGFFIDHGLGVVIGETAEIGRNVTLYQGVTLGGTGKEKGKRHPTLGNDVVVGAGAKILGGITIGNEVYIGANAVVLTPVPDDCTVVGVPGRCVKQEGVRVLNMTLRHDLLPDPILSRLDELQKEIQLAEEEIRHWHEGEKPKER